jgi:hypothetical protein
MKKGKYMNLIILLLVQLFWGCIKEESIQTSGEIVVEKINIALNGSSTNSKSIQKDLDGDGISDINFRLEIQMNNNKIVTSECQFFPTNSSGKPFLDYIVEKKDSSNYCKNLKIGDVVDSSNQNWLRRKQNDLIPINLFVYRDYTVLGLPSTNNKNEIKYGDNYIGFRYYELKDNKPIGWHNAWLKINVAMEKITIVSIGYNKNVESPITISE